MNEENNSALQEAGLIRSDGKLNARALTPEWFKKNHKENLLSSIKDLTLEISDRPLPERVWAFWNLPIQHCLTCGTPTKKAPDGSGRWQEYCSKDCAFKSHTRAENIRHSHNTKVDKVAANEKRKSSLLEKYGYSTNSQRPEVRKVLSEKASKRQVPPDVLSKLDSKEWIEEQYVTLGRTSTNISDDLGCYYGTVLDRVRKYGFEVSHACQTSNEERSIKTFIDSLGVDCHCNDFSIIHPYELDVVIPSKSLAIEMDGLYWHSIPSGDETRSNRYKHLEKTRMAAEAGYKLIHLTDYNWNCQPELSRSFIRSNLGLNERVYARKLKLKIVTLEDTKSFLTENHFQGYCQSTFRLGLYLGDTLLSLMTFSKSRFNQSYHWELVRFCTKQGITVVGGFSKLLAHFRRDHPESIISYADRMISNGSVYVNNGFTLIKETEPGYFWTDSHVPIMRSKTQRKSLCKWLSSFDPSLSEANNMFNAGYRRFWTCGNLVYVIS